MEKSKLSVIIFLLMGNVAFAQTNDKEKVELISAGNGFYQNTQPTNSAHFIGLFVEKFDSTLVWYEQVLGAKILKKNIVPQANLKFAMLDLNGFLIEMIQNPKVVSRQEINTKFSGNVGFEGFFKLGFKVKDIETQYQLMKSRGASFEYHLMDNHDFKWKLFIIQDPEGNWIQFFSDSN